MVSRTSQLNTYIRDGENKYLNVILKIKMICKKQKNMKFSVCFLS